MLLFSLNRQREVFSSPPLTKRLTLNYEVSYQCQRALPKREGEPAGPLRKNHVARQCAALAVSISVASSCICAEGKSQLHCLSSMAV